MSGRPAWPGAVRVQRGVPTPRGQAQIMPGRPTGRREGGNTVPRRRQKEQGGRLALRRLARPGPRIGNFDGPSSVTRGAAAFAGKTTLACTRQHGPRLEEKALRSSSAGRGDENTRRNATKGSNTMQQVAKKKPAWHAEGAQRAGWARRRRFHPATGISLSSTSQAPGMAGGGFSARGTSLGALPSGS